MGIEKFDAISTMNAVEILDDITTNNKHYFRAISTLHSLSPP